MDPIGRLQDDVYGAIIDCVKSLAARIETCTIPGEVRAVIYDIHLVVGSGAPHPHLSEQQQSSLLQVAAEVVNPHLETFFAGVENPQNQDRRLLWTNPAMFHRAQAYSRGPFSIEWMDTYNRVFG